MYCERNMCLPPEVVTSPWIYVPSPVTHWFRHSANSLWSALLGREFILLFSKAANINSHVEMENRPGPMKVAPPPAEVPKVLIPLMRPREE